MDLLRFLLTLPVRLLRALFHAVRVVDEQGRSDQRPLGVSLVQ